MQKICHQEHKKGKEKEIAGIYNKIITENPRKPEARRETAGKMTK